MAVIAGRKNFKFFFGKTCVEVAFKMKNQAKKIRYLIMGLNSYNDYLQKSINLEMDDLTRIIRIKIATDPNIDAIIGSISNSFDVNDKLKALKDIALLLDIRDLKSFLVYRSFGKQLKNYSIFLVTVIPVIISIIQLVIPVVIQTSGTTSGPTGNQSNYGLPNNLATSGINQAMVYCLQDQRS
jgi:hypothetical protein